MANFHQEVLLVLQDDYKFNFGDSFLDPQGQEEPRDLDEGILDREEAADPAEEESSLLG